MANEFYAGLPFLSLLFPTPIYCCDFALFYFNLFEFPKGLERVHRKNYFKDGKQVVPHIGTLRNEC